MTSVARCVKVQKEFSNYNEMQCSNVATGRRIASHIIQPVNDTNTLILGYTVPYNGVEE